MSQRTAQVGASADQRAGEKQPVHSNVSSQFVQSRSFVIHVNKPFPKKSFIHSENPSFDTGCVIEVIDLECQLLHTVLIASKGFEKQIVPEKGVWVEYASA